jgi:Xaa-Pro aminopeptidase
MPNIPAIQKALRAHKFDAWLFYDILHRDLIAYRILGIEGLAKRRWFYLIPARGTPRKLAHRIEPGMLDSLPGKKLLYSAMDELRANLKTLLTGVKTIAMQYSPKNNIPSVSLVDGGTIELIRSYGKKIVSSADLIQQFEAVWTPDQLESHLEAGRQIDRITQEAFRRAAVAVRKGETLTEYDLQQWILQRFRDAHLSTAEAPIVGVGPNSGNPHYEPQPGSSAPIRAGQVLLLDIWSKLNRPNSVYYDITWMGYLGEKVPEKYAKIFSIVRQSRERAVSFIQENLRAGKSVEGWQVDKVTRDVITKAGYGKFFTHRTGHSIGQEVHGTGANMDGLETRDERALIPSTCFSIEPGVYLPEFGVRSEVNVFVEKNDARVTGAVQTEILPLLA